MSRRWVGILILAAIGLTAFSLALSRRDSSDWRANRSRRLFPFPWRDMVSVSIDRRDGSRLEFSRQLTGEWRLRLADERFDLLNLDVAEELSALATLAWREPLREAKPPDPDTAILLEAAGLGGQRVNLAFGDTVGPLRAATVDADRSVVYGVNRELLKFLDWPEWRFRNLDLAAGGSGANAKRIVLSTAGDNDTLKIVLEKNGGGWRMASPLTWPADEARLEVLLRWLERLTANAIVAERTDDPGRYGFTPMSPVVEVDYDLWEGEAVRRVEFGADAGEGRIYARVTGRDPVFVVPAELLAEISMVTALTHPNDWRDIYRRRSLALTGDEPPAEIRIERLLPEPAGLVLRQTRDQGAVKWWGTLTRGGESVSFAVDPPAVDDPARPLGALLASLANLRIKNFLSEDKPGPETLKWTAFPAWRISCVLQGGAVSPVLTVYAADAEGRFPPGIPYVEGKSGPVEMRPPEGGGDEAGIAFSLADGAAVMELQKDLAYSLCLPLYRYRTARVLDYDSAKWVRVVVEMDDAGVTYSRDAGDPNEQWWREAKTFREPLMDDNNAFAALMSRLSQFRTPGFVAEGGEPLEEFGLDHPTITAIVYVSPGKDDGNGEGKPLFKLCVGGLAGATDGMRYARLDDMGPVFLIPADISDGLRGNFR